ncbi:MAG: GNAT family N-acetyltransferase [Clostridia bacterium]|nr:GNAT family N-acetyltransferase [Clostridia bacterium]
MVRFATEKDIPFLKHAWKVCFDDPDTFIDWNFTYNFSPSDTLIAEVDGVPASNMQLMPHKIQLRGKEYAVNYVSGVATLPEFRHRGLVRELFAFGFSVMAQRKHPISLLVPFNYEFYEKFGYRQCYEKVFRYADILPEQEYLTKEDLSDTLIQSLDGIYRKAMQDHAGYAIRTKADWQKILEDLLQLSEGRILLRENGYALITSLNGGGYEIHEQCGHISLPCREEKKPFAMARVLDPMRLLSDLAEDFDGQIRLKITDAQIPKNNICVEVGNRMVIPCQDYDQELDIRELATLVMGWTEDVTQSGLFSKQKPYLNMIF